MASLDTNALVRWLLDDVPADTKRIAKLLDSHAEFRVPDFVLIELEYVLRTKLGYNRKLVADNISYIISHNKIQIRERFYTAVLGDYLAHPKLSFLDCYAAHWANEAGSTPYYTFDQKLAKQLPNYAQLI